jgi:hypothetical protein
MGKRAAGKWSDYNRRISAREFGATRASAACLYADSGEIEMSQTTAVLLGSGICCVVPLISLSLGFYLGKYGIPLELRWRGMQRDDVD